MMFFILKPHRTALKADLIKCQVAAGSICCGSEVGYFIIPGA
jgi:hypothetical protein